MKQAHIRAANHQSHDTLHPRSEQNPLRERPGRPTPAHRTQPYRARRRDFRPGTGHGQKCHASFFGGTKVKSEYLGGAPLADVTSIYRALQTTDDFWLAKGLEPQEICPGNPESLHGRRAKLEPIITQYTTTRITGCQDA
ncbi:MAG: hypothetical protein HC945_00760 [Nitrosarchaeum sp.]|nr:hypothetical protein [Nitrosarchaeum sp.]